MFVDSVILRIGFDDILCSDFVVHIGYRYFDFDIGYEYFQKLFKSNTCNLIRFGFEISFEQ